MLPLFAFSASPLRSCSVFRAPSAKAAFSPCIINGILREKQIIRLYLHQGEGKDLKTEEMDYLHFYRNKETKIGNIVKRSQTTDGDTFTLQFEDGKKLEIDIKFIN